MIDFMKCLLSVQEPTLGRTPPFLLGDCRGRSLTDTTLATVTSTPATAMVLPADVPEVFATHTALLQVDTR
jgi:hypothetical protein